MINFNNDPNEISRAEYYDCYRKPSIEEFIDGFEYEYAAVICHYFNNIKEPTYNNYIWKYAKVGFTSGYYWYHKGKELQEMLDDNKIRVKKKSFIETTNLNHLSKLQEQVRQAHMHNKPYTIDSPNEIGRASCRERV